MRTLFDQELEQLNKDIISTGSLCEKSIQTAIKFLLFQDVDRKQEVFSMVEEISHRERAIEDMCLKIIMQQQPVATDLRIVSAALKLVSDMERIGDNADDIAEIVGMHNIDTEFIKAVNIEPMTRAARAMLSNSIDAFVNRDEKLARKVIDDDDVVDDQFNRIKNHLTDKFDKDNPNLDGVLDTFMVSKYFERIADHSVNIAQWVVFMVTGKLEGNTN